MKALVVAENIRGVLSSSTFNAINAASLLNCDIDVIVFDKKAEEAALTLSGIDCVSSVKVCNNSILENYLAEPIASFLHAFVKANNYSHVLMSASTAGKNILPRLSAQLDVEMLSEVISIIDSKTYKRPIYAGNAIATIRNNSDIQVISIRATAFDVIAVGNAKKDKISFLESFDIAGKSRFLDVSSQNQERPDLGSAKIVVSGGRGLQSKDNFKLIEKLADKLNAAIGASRAAVDAGFVANDLQVGQTGKVVAPDLYIAVGISGAIQHIAGMKDSKVIVAINKDPDAPIFQIATYGLVGDLFEIVPELCEKINA